MDILLDPSLMLLIVACIGLIITYLGTVGALRENETMLTVVSAVYVIHSQIGNNGITNIPFSTVRLDRF
jgi:hypothetical protein